MFNTQNTKVRRPEVFTCGTQTFAGRFHHDPEPAEYCENEVEHEGDTCPAHEEADDDLDYELWDEDRRERAWL
jgi:hypothetical protein